jgi:hypothetical protein
MKTTFWLPSVNAQYASYVPNDRLLSPILCIAGEEKTGGRGGYNC